MFWDGERLGAELAGVCLLVRRPKIAELFVVADV